MQDSNALRSRLEELKAELIEHKLVMDSNKLGANASFGKLGSKWSVLYSPDLLIQVTVTGQLALLMLIEMLHLNGIPVVSANTDGIVIKCPRVKSDELGLIIEHWEHETGFETEETRYSAVYSRDVNSYIAIKTNGSVKQKGALAFVGTKGMEIEKNPANYVCIDAVIAHLTNGTPISQTIKACQDISRFVTVRTVKGGALDQQGQLLGKVVRFYYANGITGPITYKSNGYTVPKSEGAKPLMILPETFPDDINYDWYINEARELLRDIGAVVPEAAHA